jgi:hypothetical protein
MRCCLSLTQLKPTQAPRSIEEQVAIGLLAEQKPCYNEDFAGFSLTTFNGTHIIV